MQAKRYYAFHQSKDGNRLLVGIATVGRAKDGLEMTGKTFPNTRKGFRDCEDYVLKMNLALPGNKYGRIEVI